MNTWPSVVVHPVPVNFPKLRLKQQRFDFRDEPKLYVCGITPYDSTHLGHAATYLYFDLVNRYLQSSGKKVRFVENVTDIDDPLLERATRDRVDWQKLASSQLELFTSDMSRLHVCSPEFLVGVTEVIPLIIKALETLVKSGKTYMLEGDMYLSIEEYLPRLPIPYEEALAIFGERGGDPGRAGKRDPLDPVLWLAAKPEIPSWPSPWGDGRPGWHIECSVISLHFLLGSDYLERDLGKYAIDLQGGGSDLIFPHHFMTSIQAEALTGAPFANAFLHVGMIGLDGEKMSKSKGNLVFVSKLLEEGVHPAALRLALMDHHYSQELMWHDGILSEYQDLLADLLLVLGAGFTAPATDLLQQIVNALANDLDTPLVVRAIKGWVEISKSLESSHVDDSGMVARALDSLLGLAL